MKNRVAIAVALIALCGLIVAAQTARSADVRFKAAQHKEEVEGDLKGAIELYRTVVESGDRALAAQALIRMASCHEKLGEGEARTIYQRVIREFVDQKDAVAIAQARLTPAPSGRTALRKVFSDSNVENVASFTGGISPDGRYLTHAGRYNTVLMIRDLIGGTERVLQEAPGNFMSAVSKDGSQVAYDRCLPTAACELWAAPLGAAGPPARRVFANADIDVVRPHDWSPDGSRIAVAVTRSDQSVQIGYVSVADGVLRVLKSVDWRGPMRMFFSPDGRNITVDLPESDNTDDRDVLVLAIDGSRETRAVVSPGNDVVIGWTPDGHSLLFASDRSGAMGLWSLPIVDGKPVGVPTIVKADIGNVVPLGVTRSGTLYWSTVVWDLDVELLPLDLATGRQTGSSSKPIQRFTGTNSQPAWSANGKWLAYRSARGSSLATGAGLGPLATAVIGIRSTETGEVRELRPALSYFRNLTWAPDGRSLVVFGTDFRGRDGVFRIDVRTSVVTPIIVPMSKSDELDYGTFSWSPDGSRLYYHKRNGSVYEHNLATGNERVIIDQPNAGRREGRLGPVRVSPDGRWIVSATLDGASAVVVLIPVEGGQARPLLRLSQGEGIHNNIPWTPDGRAVLVVKTSTPLGNPEDNQLELWHVPIDGSTPRRLDVELRGVMFGGSGRIQVSPDGRQLAVVSGRYPASEVWTLENFIPTRTTAPSVRSSTEPRNHESPCFVFSRFRACIHRAPAYGNAIAV